MKWVMVMLVLFFLTSFVTNRKPEIKFNSVKSSREQIICVETQQTLTKTKQKQKEMQQFTPNI